MYNTFGCKTVRHYDRAHKSNRRHDKLVNSQCKRLLKSGLCYCFNEEQKEDIIEMSGLEVTVKEIEGIIYLSVKE